MYLTEQATRAYAWLAKHLPDVVGSEYLANQDKSARRSLQAYLACLTDNPQALLRHEDVTALTLTDGSVEVVLSFEVLEHVPAFARALSEFHRVLRPGGTLLLSVPFAEATQANLLRARLLDDGSVEHLVEAEYHGDPVNDAGCLAFHTFGWQLLDQIRALGFSEVGLLDGWSPASGYLGFFGVIVARR